MAETLPSPVNPADVVLKIEAMLAGNASDGVKSYAIAGRTLERYSVNELLALLEYWRRRAATVANNASTTPRLGGRRIACYL